MKARCTTTSTPATSSFTAARVKMSPWRYSVFFQPRLPRSNSHLAISTPTSGVKLQGADERLSQSTVGPVTATVSPDAGLLPVDDDAVIGAQATRQGQAREKEGRPRDEAEQSTRSAGVGDCCIGGESRWAVRVAG